MKSSSGLKLLVLDIETAPHRAYVWSLFDQKRIPDDMIEEPGYTLCASWQWYGERTLHFEVVRRRSSMKPSLPALRRLAKAIGEADGIITYNGQKFDLPILRREFLEAGIDCKPLPVSMDLYRHAVTKLHFASGKMGYVAKRLGIPVQKVRHRGIDLWFGCMRGDKRSWAEMRRYNRTDVVVTGLLYEKLREHLGSMHPNAAVKRVGPVNAKPEIPRPLCERCGKDNMSLDGKVLTKAGYIRAYRCRSCGHYQRGGTNLLTPEQKKKVRG